MFRSHLLSNVCFNSFQLATHWINNHIFSLSILSAIKVPSFEVLRAQYLQNSSKRPGNLSLKCIFEHTSLSKRALFTACNPVFIDACLSILLSIKMSYNKAQKYGQVSHLWPPTAFAMHYPVKLLAETFCCVKYWHAHSQVHFHSINTSL